MSLIAFLALVGIGAGGLSSSAYVPEEAYRALGGHLYLEPLLALATALTVGLVSWTYAKIIQDVRLTGADAIIVAHAKARGIPLVTTDRPLFDRARAIVRTLAPEEVLG